MSDEDLLVDYSDEEDSTAAAKPAPAANADAAPAASAASAASAPASAAPAKSSSRRARRQVMDEPDDINSLDMTAAPSAADVAGSLDTNELDIDDEFDDDDDEGAGNGGGAGGENASAVATSVVSRTSEKNKGDTPMTLRVKILVSDSEVHHLIGKGGCRIQQIQNSTLSRVNVSRVDSFFPASRLRAVVVSGRKKPVLAALSFIMVLLRVGSAGLAGAG